MDSSDHMSMASTAGSMAMSATQTGMSMASSTAKPMSHSMGMGGDCKISMLWNWYTVDSCFIAKSWHITSKGMFAGSCIGVILLVMVLELLRRAGKEYDRYIVAQYTRSLASANSPSNGAGASDTSSNKAATATAAPAYLQTEAAQFRPNVVQQAIRALLHMCQFAVAYFIMLLAMYYNGYIIICIFIGAYLGYFVFGWESLKVGNGGRDRNPEEVTVCCG